MKLSKIAKNSPIPSNDWCLSDDLIIMIFARLPLSTLAALKLVSKKWYWLISLPSFAKSYVACSSFRSPQNLIFQINYRISSLNHTILVGEPRHLISNEFENNLPKPYASSAPIMRFWSSKGNLHMRALIRSKFFECLIFRSRPKKLPVVWSEIF